MNDLRTAVQQFLDRVNCVKEEHAVVTYDDLMLLSTALERQQPAIDWSDKAKLIDATHHARAVGFVPGTTNWASAVSSYMLNAPNKVEQPQQEPFDPRDAVVRAYLYAGRLEKDIEGLETNANWYELRQAFELLAKKAGEAWKAHHKKSAIGFNGLTEAETSASASVAGVVGKVPAQQEPVYEFQTYGEHTIFIEEGRFTADDLEQLRIEMQKRQEQLDKNLYDVTEPKL